MPPLYGYSLPKMKTSSFSDGSRGEKEKGDIAQKNVAGIEDVNKGGNEQIMTKGEETRIQNTIKVLMNYIEK